jgi:hypothetical protein
MQQQHKLNASAGSFSPLGKGYSLKTLLTKKDSKEFIVNADKY